jgi:hypothetical protein
MQDGARIAHGPNLQAPAVDGTQADHYLDETNLFRQAGQLVLSKILQSAYPFLRMFSIANQAWGTLKKGSPYHSNRNVC